MEEKLETHWEKGENIKPIFSEIKMLIIWSYDIILSDIFEIK
jgi:hypothetical protein